MSDRKKDEGDDEDDLPVGWTRAWSRSKQKVYYCNRKLGVSQWSKPTKEDELEILHVLSEMGSTNKARNTMIRNARKRLKEREMLDQSEKKKVGRAVCDEHKTSSRSHSDKTSKHVKPGQFVRTFSVVTEDGDDGKKVKVDVPFLAAAKSDATSQGTVKIRGEEDASRRETLKFKLKQDKMSKILKARKKDSSVVKMFAKRNDVKEFSKEDHVKSAVKRREFRTKRERRKRSDLDDSGYEVVSSHHGNKICEERYAGDILPQNDPVSVSTALSGTAYGESHGHLSPDKASHDQEEDMEYETTPEDYAKLMNEISDVRENFSSTDVGEQQLTSQFFSSGSFTVTTQQSKVLYIIIDTNILLNSPHFLIMLESIRITDYIGLCLVIPWIVMTELDFIKDNKKNLVSERTQKMARLAVSYLHNHLQRKDSFIVVQTPAEACKKYKKLEIITNNDDKILQCCIQWQEKYPQSEIILLTGDKHLSTKAMVLDIPAYKERTLQKWLDERKVCEYDKQNSQRDNQSQLTAFIDGQHSDVSDCTSQGSVTQYCANQSLSFTSSDINQSATSIITDTYQSGASCIQAMEAEHVMPKVSISANCLSQDPVDSINQNENNSITCLQTASSEDNKCFESSSTWNQIPEHSLSSSEKANTFLEKVQSVLQSGLGGLVEFHMKAVYGDLWKSIVYKKPPWSVDDVLICLKKHWIAVFGDLLGRKNLDQLDEFISAAKTCQGNCYSEVLIYLKKALSLCENFKENTSDDRINVVVWSLHKVKEALEYVITNNLPPDSVVALLNEGTSLDDSKQCLDIVQSAFQDIWLKIFNISTEFRACLIGTQTPSERVAVVRAFAEFCGLVARIHHHYSEMLSDKTATDDVDHHLQLCSSLIHSLSDVAKYYNMMNWKQPAAELVYSFINEPQGRLIINNGFVQLQSLMSALCEYNKFLSAEESQLVQAAINKSTAIS